MNSTREERPRRGRLVAAFFGFGVGLFGLAVGLNRPSIANMRTLDLVHLLTTGAGLGVGLVWVVLYFGGRRTG
jgi:hypothetical protein